MSLLFFTPYKPQKLYTNNNLDRLVDYIQLQLQFFSMALYNPFLYNSPGLFYGKPYTQRASWNLFEEREM